MKIAIAGPISRDSIKSLLDADASLLPEGYLGAPFLGTLIATLIRRGHAVSAFTLDPTLDDRHSDAMFATGPNFRIVFLPYRKRSIRPSHGHVGRLVDFFKRERMVIQEALQADKPNVVHAHWSYEFALAAIASNVPHVITCHDSPRRVLQYMPNVYRLGRYFMARRVFQKARVVTAVSEYLRDEIQPYVQTPITVIPNPAPEAIMGIKRIATSAELDTAPRVAMVLNGWTRIKNPQPALIAFAKLHESVPGATLHLFGDDYGPEQKAQRWLLKRRMTGGVVLHGPVSSDRLLQQLATMHVLLHPALEEACPLSLIEAMSLGILVIGGESSGGVPWMLAYGEAGFLTDVRSPDAMHRTLLAVIRDVPKYEAMRRQGMRHVRALCNPDKVTEQYEKMYATALSGNQAQQLNA